jgi:lysophospholipase L1-like esterase
MKKLSLFACIFLFLACVCGAQATFPPFSDNIQNFKRKDSSSPPPSNAILFVGSSSFTRWTDLESYFPGYPIINRGFGGSTLADVIRYTYDVILPYQPKQVIIYCGENDLADNVSVNEVVKRFKTLFQMIRLNLPATVIHFVSLKPSPSRQALLPKIKEVNDQAEAFLKGEKNAGFINVYPYMLDEKGKIMEDIFVADKLHMNEKGYAIWKKLFQPYLIK